MVSIVSDSLASDYELLGNTIIKGNNEQEVEIFVDGTMNKLMIELSGNTNRLKSILRPGK